MREHKSCLAWVFDFKLGCFAYMHVLHDTRTHPPTHTHPHTHNHTHKKITHKITHTHTSKVEKLSLGFILLTKVFPWHVQVAPKLVGENLKVGPSSFAQYAFGQMTVDKIPSTWCSDYLILWQYGHGVRKVMGDNQKAHRAHFSTLNFATLI
jgi:hypothetical protein